MTSIKAKKIKFRTAYDPPVRVGFATVGESKTNPQFAEETKIQNIIERYDTQGYLSTIDKSPQYADFTNVTDLHGAILQVNEAQEAFQTVPSYIRERFDNDPKLFYDFAMNEDNYDELADMGLIDNPRPRKTPVEPDNTSQPIVEKTQESLKEDS